MAARFHSFVVFAGMRTGSNLLEANLNSLTGVSCFGEAFNPHFLGYPSSDPILGIDQDARDADPAVLLTAFRNTPEGLSGFRYFHDHDPRVFDAIMDDPGCAKIILTRNPVDSYVSWKIAKATDQWKLTDTKRRKSAQAVFDDREFAYHVETIQAFQATLLRKLQISGQTAFYVGYDDLHSVEVMNGLAAFLGVEDRLQVLNLKLKKQNPGPISAKVGNFPEMQRALAKFDRFNLHNTPNFEPRRGPKVPSYVAGAKTPLLYLPLRGGAVPQITAWLAELDGVERGDLGTGMTQKELRLWKRRRPGHRSFTVIRHPLARAHDVFCRHILPVDGESRGQLRRTMIRRYRIPLPPDGPDDAYDMAAHRAAFAAYLSWLRGNLAGQTSIRVDATWCSQVQAISGFGDLWLPDRILREDSLATELPALAATVGRIDAPVPPPAEPDAPYTLDMIYDAELEELCQRAYQRDYLAFGFSDWR